MFFILSKLNAEKLMAIIIVIIIAYYIDYHLKKYNKEKENDFEVSKTMIKNDVANVKEVSIDHFYIKESQKSIKYLVKNKQFIDIIQNIRFVKKFDKTKYTNIVITMDHLMKVYIYILSDRYDLNTHLPIFIDLQTNVSEIFYSLYFVIPDKFKHMYGFEPHKEIEKSLHTFIVNCNKMKTVLKNYGKIGKNENFINIEKYRPYEKNKEHIMP
jgi:hypothetical protein